jgi:cell division transport system ATP-binding protein
MLKFDNVSKRYSEAGEVLSGISFHLERGEMAFLTGHSGAGKSTLFKLIALIERASRGQIYLDGHNVSRAQDHQIPFLRRKMGLIFQDF